MAKKNNKKKFIEEVIHINRVSKKTKGGDKMSFSALVVVGNKKGKIGVGFGKAPSVLSAIKKAVRKGKENLIEVPISNGTIPCQIKVKRGAAEILMKPAPEGTGIVAGGSVRKVVEVAGIKNIVSKILGTRNKASNLYAVLKAFKKLKKRQIRNEIK